jgi:arylsulfatase
VAEFLTSFQAFPPRQRPATFNLDQVMQSLQQPRQ